MMKFDLQLFASEFDITITGVSSESGGSDLALADNKILKATLTNTSITTATLDDLKSTDTIAVAYAIGVASDVTGKVIKLADVTATSVTFVAGLSGVTIKEGTAGEFKGVTFSSGDTTSFAVEAPTGTAIGSATSITFSASTNDVVTNATNLVMASGATVAFATESTSVVVKDSTEGNTLTIKGTLNLVNDSIATAGAVTGMAAGASVSGLAEGATAAATGAAGTYTVNNAAMTTDSTSALTFTAGASGVTAVTGIAIGKSISGVTAGATVTATSATDTLTVNTQAVKFSASASTVTATAKDGGISDISGLKTGDTISGYKGEYTINEKEITLSGDSDGVNVTGGTDAITTKDTVTTIAGLDAGATIVVKADGVAVSGNAPASGNALKDRETITVNGTTYKQGLGYTSGAVDAITVTTVGTAGTASYLTGGSVYLNADDSSNTKVATMDTNKVTQIVTATTGDITVTVSGTALYVGDLDNGDAFTIGAASYSVINGKLYDMANTANPIGTGSFDATDEQAGFALYATGTVASTTLTGTTKVTNFNESKGIIATTPDVSNTKLSVAYGDGTAHVVSQVTNGTSLNENGTTSTSSSSSSIGTLSYDASTEVVTYDASSSRKKQTVSVGTDNTNTYNIVGSTYGDALTGNNKNTTLSGGAGKDTLTAGGATDVLVGGEGADMFDMTAGKFANVSDFSLTDGDVLKTTVAGGTTPTRANLTLNAEGVAVVGTGSATIQSSGGFYGAKFGDANGENGQIVAWAGENATTIDNSGTNFKNVILVGTTNENGDNLVGGSSKDTLYGGANDTLVGGEGKDTYVLTAADAGQIVSISTTSGKDTVTSGFTKGFDLTESDGLNVTAGSSADVNVIYDSANATVKAGDSAYVQINNLTADATTKTVDLNINGAKVAAIANSTVAKISEANYADWYLGTKASGIDFSGVDNNMEVNLGDTDHYRNIATLKGGSGNTTLIGGAKAESLVAGSGQTSLWGGTAGNDTLVSGTDATSFFYGTGNGKDVVTGFKMADADTSDVLTFIDGGFGSVSRTSAGAFEVRMASGEKLTVNQSVSGADKAVKWQLMDGTASGLAKFALANNRLTYDKDVTLYVGTSSKDTVSVASSADNASVWLDGSQGVAYNSIEVVDAKSATGNVTLAGGSSAETIYGGQGASSLWGGADNSNDVLVGSGKGTAMFFYGLGQGNDVINATTKDDTINLYGVKLSDITSAVVDSTKVTVTTTANETLTVNGSVTKFITGDGQTFYADRKNKGWSTTAV